MPSTQRGSVVKRGSRWGARWYDEQGQRRFRGGFETKSAAREWLDSKVSDTEALRRGERPVAPKLVRTIDDFVQKSGGAAGPHGAYALPGRMLIPSLSNKDGTGMAALVEYSNDGDYIAT